MKKYLCLTGLFVALASGVSLSQSGATETKSLGEIARQQRSAKKAEKVFTEEDLPARSSSSETSSSALIAPGTPAQAAASPVGKSTVVEKKEAVPAKNGGAAEAKAKLDHYTAERDAWQQAVKRYEDLLANEKDPFRRQTYDDALSVDRHNLELYQAKIEEIQASQAKTSQDSSASSASAAGPGASPDSGGHQ